MQIRIVSEEADSIEERIEQSVEENRESSPETPAGGSPDEFAKTALYQTLELDNDSEKYSYRNEVDILLDWAKKTTGSTDPFEIKWAVRDLQMRLGTPPFGDRIKHVARFAYLDLEETKIKEEKRMFND